MLAVGRYGMLFCLVVFLLACSFCAAKEAGGTIQDAIEQVTKGTGQQPGTATGEGSALEDALQKLMDEKEIETVKKGMIDADQALDELFASGGPDVVAKMTCSICKTVALDMESTLKGLVQMHGKPDHALYSMAIAEVCENGSHDYGLRVVDGKPVPDVFRSGNYAVEVLAAMSIDHEVRKLCFEMVVEHEEELLGDYKKLDWRSITQRVCMDTMNVCSDDSAPFTLSYHEPGLGLALHQTPYKSKAKPKPVAEKEKGKNSTKTKAKKTRRGNKFTRKGAETAVDPGNDFLPKDLLARDLKEGL